MTDVHQTTPAEPSIFSAEHALRTTIEQAIGMIDAAKRDAAPVEAWLPTLRRTLRGGLVAAEALNGGEDA